MKTKTTIKYNDKEKGDVRVYIYKPDYFGTFRLISSHRFSSPLDAHLFLAIHHPETKINDETILSVKKGELATL